jgi:pimeloyl-ACP methyl ester carboxylesterase
MLYRLGIRLICYDRPGYGGSERCPDRSVANAAADVRTIADALRLGTFAVAGRSGGAPHALACAARLGERVQSVAALVGLAPPDASDLDWYDGMTDSNTAEFGRADADPGAIAETLTERGRSATSAVYTATGSLARPAPLPSAVSSRRPMRRWRLGRSGYDRHRAAHHPSARRDS